MPTTCPGSLAAGIDTAQMQAVLRHNGLDLVEIEFLGGWAFAAAGSGGISPSLAGIEGVADALGGRQVSAGEFSGDTPLDTDEALERAARALRAKADRLARRGLLVALESFPWSALSNTHIAINLLRRAQAANAGLLIDVWHFYNGGAHPDDLVGLPAAGITGVQLNDGPLVHENFQHHARAQRQLPGEGDLNVVALIHAVRRAGFTGPYCVEANTPSSVYPPRRGGRPPRRRQRHQRAARRRHPGPLMDLQLAGAGHWSPAAAAASVEPFPLRCGPKAPR
jgi:sugar phosphate isomerase/epimerase